MVLNSNHIKIWENKLSFQIPPIFLWGGGRRNILLIKIRQLIIHRKILWRNLWGFYLWEFRDNKLWHYLPVRRGILLWNIMRRRVSLHLNYLNRSWTSSLEARSWKTNQWMNPSNIIKVQWTISAIIAMLCILVVGKLENMLIPIVVQ